MIPQNVCQCLCLITISRRSFWRPEVDENWAIMVVQPAILTYPTMFFLLLTRSTGPMEWSTRITKYLNKYVRRGFCLIYMFSFYFWSPSLARKMRKTKKRYYPEYPSRSYVQTFGGIIHVCQAILDTGSGRKLSHNGCTAGNFDLPNHGFFYFWLAPQVLWNDLIM
jgi:hypothetical protein